MESVFSTQLDRYAAKQIDNLVLPDNIRSDDLKSDVSSVVKYDDIEWRLFLGTSLKEAVPGIGVYLVGRLQSKTAKEADEKLPNKGVLGVILGQKRGDSCVFCAMVRIHVNGEKHIYKAIKDGKEIAVFNEFSEARQWVDIVLANEVSNSCLERRQKVLERKRERERVLDVERSVSVSSGFSR